MLDHKNYLNTSVFTVFDKERNEPFYDFGSSLIRMHIGFRTRQHLQQKRDERRPIPKVADFSASYMLYFATPLRIPPSQLLVPKSQRKQVRTVLLLFHLYSPADLLDDCIPLHHHEGLTIPIRSIVEAAFSKR